jgi:hypothetical protein
MVRTGGEELMKKKKGSGDRSPEPEAFGFDGAG